MFLAVLAARPVSPAMRASSSSDSISGAGLRRSRINSRARALAGLALAGRDAEELLDVLSRFALRDHEGDLGRGRYVDERVELEARPCFAAHGCRRRPGVERPCRPGRRAPSGSRRAARRPRRSSRARSRVRRGWRPSKVADPKIRHVELVGDRVQGPIAHGRALPCRCRRRRGGCRSGRSRSGRHRRDRARPTSEPVNGARHRDTRC